MSREFVDAIVSGNNIEAEKAFTTSISTKVGDALEVKRKEISSNLLIYIKNNSPEEGVVIEDRTDPEKNVSHEFKTTEIFKASDTMVDSLLQLLERERKKKAS